MDDIEALKQYGSRMQSQAAPPVDVTARVLQTIRNRRERPIDSVRPLAMVLAAGWAAAIAVGFFVQQAWWDVQDPVAALVTPFVVALQ
jgi:hypothetical protein